jgi:hypothetical protein
MNRTRNPTGKGGARKSKKSYSLSRESVEFLETTRKRRRASSVSAVLEDIVQAARRSQGRAALETAVSDYYSALPDREREEQSAWGDFAWREFPSEGA